MFIQNKFMGLESTPVRMAFQILAQKSRVLHYLSLRNMHPRMRLVRLRVLYEGN